MTIEARTLGGGQVTISAEALQAFRAGFRGTVLTAQDAAYDDVRSVWNAMIDRRPALIARCSGTADVRHAVRFAREHRLLSSVRSGGHNVAGLAVVEGGLMIDTSMMRGVWVDPVARRARAQGGCLLGDVDRETQVHGLAAVLGFVSATGIAGLTTGGGFGYLSRKHGWTCDTVRSMEVVTAAGEVVRASADENADLFWALRGGSGNFGIVTSFEYELFPVGPTIQGGAIAWRASDGPAVLRKLSEVAAAAPRDLTLVGALRLAPPAPWLPKEVHGQPIVAVFVCHHGAPEDTAKLLAPLRATGTVVADIVQARPYTQMQALLDATQPKGRRYYWKSEYLPGIADGLVDAALARLATITSPHTGILFFQLGGAIGDLPVEHSPAGNRDAAFVCNIAGSWDQAADDEANLAWTRGTHDAIRPFGTGGVYVNFLSEDDGAERVTQAYGANLDRLATIKRTWDPDGVFRHTKQIG